MQRQMSREIRQMTTEDVDLTAELPDLAAEEIRKRILQQKNEEAVQRLKDKPKPHDIPQWVNLAWHRVSQGLYEYGNWKVKKEYTDQWTASHPNHGSRSFISMRKARAWVETQPRN